MLLVERMISKNTLAASWKVTPCFRWFVAAFRAFHSKRTQPYRLPLGITAGELEEIMAPNSLV
jgi:hypothetical protein